MNLIRTGCRKVKRWTDQAVHPIHIDVKDTQVRAMYDQEELKQVKFRLKGLALFYAGSTLSIAISGLSKNYFDFN